MFVSAATEGGVAGLVGSAEVAVTAVAAATGSEQRLIVVARGASAKFVRQCQQHQAPADLKSVLEATIREIAAFEASVAAEGSYFATELTVALTVIGVAVVTVATAEAAKLFQFQAVSLSLRCSHLAGRFLIPSLFSTFLAQLLIAIWLIKELQQFELVQKGLIQQKAVIKSILELRLVIKMNLKLEFSLQAALSALLIA